MQPAPQDHQLMSKHCVLSFKPHLRLEWRGQDGDDETEQPDHSASLGDSVPPSTRIRSHGEVDSDRRSGRVRLQTLTLETTMQVIADRPEAPSAIRTNLGAIFASLELSHSTWLITSLSPGSGEK